MKNISVHELLGRLRLHFIENDIARKYADEQPPIRSELFNLDQIEIHGRKLAGIHKIGNGQIKDKLLKRFAGNEKILVEVRNLLTEANHEGRLITPAGEWLLDNFYLIEENIHIGKRHLPKKYSESLPNLENTANSGLPRVYDLAFEIIAHSDGRLDIESLRKFIAAYQDDATLQIGELWAIPIMLRFALIENLRRVSVRVAIDRINQNLADYWAALMIKTADQEPKNLIIVIAEMARSGPPMESSFVAELIRQLMWKGPSLALPFTWLEQRLSETGMTSNELVTRENQKQAADQVSISNSINSLRLMDSINWEEFVEEMSIVEHTLREEESGIYPKMDFQTRDLYRHSVERIAKYSDLTETDVASIVVKLATENKSKQETGKSPEHIGYYLVGDGLKQTEKRASLIQPFYYKFRELLKRHGFLFYTGSILVISLLVGYILVDKAFHETRNYWLLFFISAISFLAASSLATSVINWLVTLVFKPNILPRMDFSKGIPPEFTTLVVVPAMLVDRDQVGDLMDMLEVRFLANRDKNLYFGLLTDFQDAESETLPGDAPLLEFAQKQIEDLNKKYNSSRNLFYLFHRPRKWNAYDKIWMGYERKRGKLSELNALLRGKDQNYFSLIVGDIASMPKVKYVITLDSDTQLPHDTGWKLVGTMAHPLNKPVYDSRKNRVVEGYGLLQPRVSVSLSRSGNSLYSLIHGNEPGIDPYTRMTSDVYQDLFEEGSFIGKGIYDVDVFEQTLNGRFPENRVLSHDLLEGSYIRSGLLTDVQLYEEYPMQYSKDVNRRHRWIRGDWQIGYWALPFAPGPDHKLGRNHLSGLSRWKIFDNLRRSLIATALTLLLILGWTVLKDPFFWTLAVIIIIIKPSLISFVWNLFKKSNEFTLKQHFVFSFVSIADGFFRSAFMLVCLPYESYYSIDAIIRTGWRLLITHKKLLEWNLSGRRENTSEKTLVTAYRSMWFSPFIAVVIFEYLLVYYPFALTAATPFLVAWAGAPLIAWLISKPLEKQELDLTGDQVMFLRKIARKTWAYFENFIRQEENWLPPDNYQESSRTGIAHRTSPTNIGISFLAGLSAYDFGYITMTDLLDRTVSTMSSLHKLERYRGHLYNWYDTLSLQPLSPKYISTVDSGNMAGHLLTLRQGLLALPAEKINILNLFVSLRDTVSILSQQIPKNILVQQLLMNVEFAINSAPMNSITAKKYAGAAQKYALEIRDSLVVKNEDVLWWTDALARQCDNINKELSVRFPWLLLNPVPPKFLKFVYDLDCDCGTLNDLANIEKVLPEIKSLQLKGNTESENEWLGSLARSISQAAQYARQQLEAVHRLEIDCQEFANVEYDFLYDKTKHLLAIGYNVDEHRRETGYYDLLASEARLCTFVAISQGKLPHESWFALGRLLAYGGGAPLLLSWSGSMFEYLMPLLVMPEYKNTLLSQTNKNAVARQIRYGEERKTPWGISESCYNAFDQNLNYQYRAFGVPGTGFKRGLGEDLVVAPYASVLALMVDPHQACNNMLRFSSDGFEGRFGFYEAIDYTPSRVPRGQSMVVIQSFMVHHQAMSLLSLAYTLLGQPMQKRFESDLQFRSAMLLLQERVPKTTTFYTHSAEIATVESAVTGSTELRTFNTPNTPIPEVQLLSNGRYHVMVTNAGGGYSKWKDLAITRWQEDGTCDNKGSFCYIRDTETGIFWSNAYQPACGTPKNYEATFTQGRADFRRLDNNIETHTEIVVSPEDDMEMRRLSITNHSRKYRILDITSYAEVVLGSGISDTMHPAFSKLFVNTEILSQKHAILCQRRPRSDDEHTPWLFHLMTLTGAGALEVSFETDRMQFIGRGNTLSSPNAMNQPGKLSGGEGAVLDPIVAIRYKLNIGPEETVVIDMITGVSDTREACITRIDKYQDKKHKDRVFELAWTHNQVVLRQINATEAQAQLYGRLAGSVIFNNPLLRAEPSVILKNRRTQSGLWGYSISGDLPIVLLEIENEANIELAKQMVQAHTYWRSKGLATDLVIWNEDHGGYRQHLQNEILGLITADMGSELTDHPGGIFVRIAEQIAEEDRILFQAVARVIISDKKGTLEDHVNRKSNLKNTIPVFSTIPNFQDTDTEASITEDLVYFNETGGFSPDGREYIIITRPGRFTPLPWSNILSNPNFGAVISESGQSYTWVENAHELRLTPWDNDPVIDSSGEAFYIRDEETGYFWSPMPLPACGKTHYLTRHAYGYSIFEHNETDIETEMSVYVDAEECVKFFIINIKNNSGRERRLSATGYVDWVLGDLKSKSYMHTITEVEEGGALLARNYYNSEFAGRICFLDTDERNKTFTGDRTEFIGRNCSLKKPEAMSRRYLSGKCGSAADPCCAIQTGLVLADKESHTVIFRLGSAKNNEELNRVLKKFKGIYAAKEALKRVQNSWKQVIGKIQVVTPDPALDVLMNGWLLYQVIGSRLWARSGYYQSGGAYGFRDQLQDVLAVMHTDSSIARSQIVLCASRQFAEGDVQHWWHPPVGRGVRTLCSDDLLWLPYVTANYINKTGDETILDESIGFLSGRKLSQNEKSYYDIPGKSDEMAGLYQHCVRAIEHSLRFGVHGLPLMGTGDWNDGMDLVGEDGKGESIWLGFFLYKVLTDFANIAIARSDKGFAEKCVREALQLQMNLEKHGWDGQWYKRAYFDNGVPLGSKENPECRIDSISQSWAALSGAGENSHIQQAVESADHFLVNQDGKLIQLLTPPFDSSSLNPGYIKGYVPGIRENGGQYTHAAVWLIMAQASLGNHERAWELLNMINPVNHTDTREKVAVYKAEPYVVAADVYSVKRNRGRGGWTWYTGSAGWMYQLILEWLLGFRVKGNKLEIRPCIPAKWDSFKINYVYKNTTYYIRVIQEKNRREEMVIELDGVKKNGKIIPLTDDMADHNVVVYF